MSYDCPRSQVVTVEFLALTAGRAELSAADPSPMRRSTLDVRWVPIRSDGIIYLSDYSTSIAYQTNVPSTISAGSHRIGVGRRDWMPTDDDGSIDPKEPVPANDTIGIERLNRLNRQREQYAAEWAWTQMVLHQLTTTAGRW